MNPEEENHKPEGSTNATEEENQKLLQLGIKTKEQALTLEKDYSEAA